MMNRRCWILTVMFFLTLAPNGWAYRDARYINIDTPFLKKIPLAVPLFKTENDSPLEQNASRTGADLLSDTLEFTGYFQALNREAFLGDPGEKGIASHEVNFASWTLIGAELLVTGGVQETDGILSIELRLFDVFKNRMLVGKRYRGGPDDLRRIIRKFCGEVVRELTGNRGIFESKIAFISDASGKKEIYTSDFDGFHPEQITHDNSIVLSPAWSPDGRWIAYTSYRLGKPDLHIRRIGGTQIHVVDREGVNISPAWVPDQFELAATLSFSGDPEIYLLTGQGKLIRRLTDSWGIDVSPSFSPDGKHMAFVSQRAGTPQIYIKNLKDGSDRRLTFEGRYNTTPSWSPRGDRIAFSSMDQGRFDIHVIGVNGENPMMLTRDAGDNESPSWSPDGALIVFSSTREGPSRIYVMTAYGSDQMRLLSLPGSQTQPRWSMNIDD